MINKLKLSNILKIATFTLLFCACLFYSFIYPKNSDASITSAMAQDIVNGNIFLNDWYISTRSDYFTDILLHSVVYFFTRNMYDNAFITGTIIAFLFFLCGYLIYKKIMKKNDLWPLFLGLSMIYLVGSGCWVVFSPMHITTIACCLLALYFYFDTGKMATWYFFLLLFIVFVSDNYSVTYLAIPLLIENVIYFAKNKKTDMKFLFIFIALGLAYLFNEQITTIGYEVPGIPINFTSKEALGERIAYIFWAPLEYFNVDFWGQPIKLSINLLWSLFYAGFGLLLILVHFYAAIKYKLNNRIITVLLISSVTVVSALTIINLDLSPRYYAGAIFNGCILLCVVISSYKIEKKWPILLGFLLLFAGCFLLFEKYQQTEFKNTPEQKIADVIKNNNNLKYGIAAFWNAYNLDLLLNENKLIAVLPDGQKFSWLTKETWYNRPIDFVLIKKSATISDINCYIPEKTIKKLGNIKQEIETDDYKIYIYEKPIYINKNTFNGDELYTNIERKVKTDGTVEANSTTAGFLTFGPYLTIRRGKYSVTLEYEYHDADDSFFEVTANAGNNILAREFLPQDKTQIQLNFTVKEKTVNIEFRTFYSGKGILHIKSVHINKNS